MINPRISAVWSTTKPIAPVSCTPRVQEVLCFPSSRSIFPFFINAAISPKPKELQTRDTPFWNQQVFLHLYDADPKFENAGMSMCPGKKMALFEGQKRLVENIHAFSQ